MELVGENSRPDWLASISAASVEMLERPPKVLSRLLLGVSGFGDPMQFGAPSIRKECRDVPNRQTDL